MNILFYRVDISATVSHRFGMSDWEKVKFLNIF